MINNIMMGGIAMGIIPDSTMMAIGDTGDNSSEMIQMKMVMKKNLYAQLCIPDI
jgi:hypothetical protein